MSACNEEARLAVLRSLEILDTGADRRFDRISQLAAEIFETSGALFPIRHVLVFDRVLLKAFHPSRPAKLKMK